MKEQSLSITIAWTSGTCLRICVLGSRIISVNRTPSWRYLPCVGRYLFFIHLLSRFFLNYSVIIVYHCLSLFIIVYHFVIIVYHCLSLFIIVCHCLSLFIIIHHCLSLFIIVYHCLSLYIIVYHCLILFIIVYHCLSLCNIVYHCVSLFIIV